MVQKRTESFMRAVLRFEGNGDVEPLIALFTEDVILHGLNREIEHGHDGARRFWREYVESFDSVRSAISYAKDAEDLAVLEWESTGKLPTGEPVTYRGVSVLEFRGEKVARFATYYDSAKFVPLAGEKKGPV